MGRSRWLNLEPVGRHEVAQGVNPGSERAPARQIPGLTPWATPLRPTGSEAEVSEVKRS